MKWSSCLFSDTRRRSQPLLYYQETLLTPKSCGHRISLWDSSPECWMGRHIPPKKPRPCTRDKLPSLPSLSLRSVKLSAFKEEYLAHSVHAQGVSDVRCLLSHQLATIKTPRAALHPQTWAEGEVQCVNSRNTAERSWQWGNCSFIVAHETKKIQDLPCDQGKKKPQETGNARQIWGKGRGKDFWLVYNPQLNEWQNGFVHLNHPLWTLSFAN